MTTLILISIIWAFSFGMTKAIIDLDPNYVVFIRLILSISVFIPFMKIKASDLKMHGQLAWIGAIQFGLFYCFSGWSYRYLASYQVALFTIFMPIYITLINDYYDRKFQIKSLITAALATLGAAIILMKPGFQFSADLIIGFLLMQGSSFCYSYGQIKYKKLKEQYAHFNDREVFTSLFLGALPVAALALFQSGGWVPLNALSLKQIIIILHLGLISSGICFYLWNKMTTQVSTSSLAVFSNIKIPMAVLASMLVFNEDANLLQLCIGGGIVLISTLISEHNSSKKAKALIPQKV